MITTEQRSFNVHPGIIKHLIKEQAGTLVKAVAELVMNSIDAGATRIDLDFREDGTFTVKDDGRGFRDRSEIENFFETFGTPHSDGDATYGRFRIGRGQIMAFANTTWRSGNFIMEVSLLETNSSFGYTLTQTSEFHEGCKIDGVITDENVLEEAKYTGLIECEGQEVFFYGRDDRDFISAIQYVAVPVYIHGSQVTKLPVTQKWTCEDEFGYYSFNSSAGLVIYNQGVYVYTAERRDLSVGGIFVSKQPIKLNMARNAWLEYDCLVYDHLRAMARKEFRAAIERTSKMSEPEIGAIIYRIARQDKDIGIEEAELLFNSRFLPTLGGERISPNMLLSSTHYSLYDGRSSLIGEKAISEGGVALLVPSVLGLARLMDNDKMAEHLLNNMIRLFKKWICKQERLFIPFTQLKESYSGTFHEVKDSELTTRQLAALKAIRHVGLKIKSLTKDVSGISRRMIAGKSDCASAWTNGFDYIAFNVQVLEHAFLTSNSGGVERLVNLAIHEYCHQAESSVESHEHTLHFYKTYHDATIGWNYYEILRACHRQFLKSLLKGGNKISSIDRSHASAMALISVSMDELHPQKKRRT